MKHGPLYLRSTAKPSATRVAPKGLPTHKKFKIGGEWKQMPVAYFDKPAISVGKYVHSVTGQRFKVTPERIDRWVEKFRKMKRSGVEVPTPVDHSDAAEDNRGFVVDARREGKTLVLTHQAIGKDAAKLALRNRCSVLIDPDFRDGNGKRWGDVIAHSAYTPKPVVHGHGSFQPIAASRAGGVRKVPVFTLSRSNSSEEPTMAKATTVKSGLAALKPEHHDKLRKLLGMKRKKRGVKIKADEFIGAALKAHPTKATKALSIVRKAVPNMTAVAASRGQVDDEVDDLDDDDAVADADDDELNDDEADEDDSDDEGADEDDDAEEDESAQDEADDADDDEADKPQSRRVGKVSASRGNEHDRLTRVMASRALKTEIDDAVRRGGISPDTADALRSELLPKGKPTKIALSAVAGSNDLFAFRLFRILGRNKPVPMREKSGSQARLALSGSGHGSNKDREAAREAKREKKETAKWCAKFGGNRSAKTA